MSTEPEPPARRVVHRGRIFELGVDHVRLPSGVTTDLEVIRHPGAAAVVPVTETGEVLLIEQYRHAAGGLLWEVPAGTLQAGEEPRACALRELVEEAGVSAGRLVELGCVVPVPGYSTERIHLFAAFDLLPARQKFDDDEFITAVRAFSPAEIHELLANGRLEDAKSAVALGRMLLRGMLEKPSAAAHDEDLARELGADSLTGFGRDVSGGTGEDTE